MSSSSCAIESVNAHGDVEASRFIRDVPQYESDMEDRPNDDSVLPGRFSREWIGPGDFVPDKFGHAKCNPHVAEHMMRWVAKHRDRFDIDGQSVRGRWYNKYFECYSRRGTVANQ